MPRRLPATLLVACLLSALGVCDVLTLHNGDRLTGRVLSLVDAKLRFDTEFAGTLTIDAAQVEWVLLDDAATIVLAGGRRVQGTIVPGPGGSLLLRAGGAERPLAWNEVVAINPPAPSLPRWNGSVTSNLNVAQSNTDTRVFNVDLEAQRKGKTEETTVAGSYLFGQQTRPDSGETVTTQDSWGVSGQYNRFASERTSSFVSARLERDGIVDLDLRSILGAGVGFLILDRGDTRWWGEVGVTHMREQFSGAGGARERLTGQFSYRFRTRVLGRVELAHEIAVYPALDQLDDSFLSSKLTLRTPLSQTMFANFRFVYDYDTTPAPGSTKTSSKYTFGIGYRF